MLRETSTPTPGKDADKGSTRSYGVGGLACVGVLPDVGDEVLAEVVACRRVVADEVLQDAETALDGFVVSGVRQRSVVSIVS